MNGISCFVNFRENLSKNVPYYSLLIKQIYSDGEDMWIGENAALSVGGGNIVTKICEGYQFTIAFFGQLLLADELKKELTGFGYHFLSEKDAELALLSYIHFGEKCTERLCGSFSFIIYDAMRRRVVAFSGKNTKIPLFYGKASGGYALSPSVQGLLSCPDIAKQMTSESVLELISVQNRISDRIFDNVCMLSPSSCLIISCDGISTKECAFEEQADLYNEENVTHGARFFHDKLHPSSIDKGSVLYGLESSVIACGFPVLSRFDSLLPIAIRCAQSTDETAYFIPSEKNSSYKNYLWMLIENDAFHYAVKENLSSYRHTAQIIPDYAALIGNFFNVSVSSIPHAHCHMFGKDEDPYAFAGSLKIKTTLRHILLDIISKEHSPILAFFKRSALLNLCEGRFVFPQNFSESELTAYLIKLNIWFLKYRPHII